MGRSISAASYLETGSRPRVMPRKGDTVLRELRISRHVVVGSSQSASTLLAVHQVAGHLASLLCCTQLTCGCAVSRTP